MNRRISSLPGCKSHREGGLPDAVDSGGWMRFSVENVMLFCLGCGRSCGLCGVVALVDGRVEVLKRDGRVSEIREQPPLSFRKKAERRLERGKMPTAVPGC